MEGDFWFFFLFHSLWLVCYKYTFHVIPYDVTVVAYVWHEHIWYGYHPENDNSERCALV